MLKVWIISSASWIQIPNDQNYFSKRKEKEKITSREMVRPRLASSSTSSSGVRAPSPSWPSISLKSRSMIAAISESLFTWAATIWFFAQFYKEIFVALPCPCRTRRFSWCPCQVSSSFSCLQLLCWSLPLCPPYCSLTEGFPSHFLASKSVRSVGKWESWLNVDTESWVPVLLS